MLNSILIGVALSTATQVLPQPEVVVTASRVAQTADATLATVDVIDRDEIQRVQARDAVDLLRRLPGIDIARNGGPGGATSVFLRGSNSNHTLVLIDGVRVASVNTGAYTFEHLPIDLIERIEIVRGPRAAIWGADALGGVIQIFTRRDAGLAATARVASDGDYLGAAYIGVGDDELGASVAAQRRTLDGFTAQLPGSFGYDPDADGLRQTSLSANLHGRVGDALKIDGNAYGNDADVEFDQGRSDVRQRSAALTVDHAFNDQWSQKFALTAASDDLSTPAFYQRFETEREGLDWILRKDGESTHWAFGLSALHERGGNHAIGFGDTYRESRSQRGVFGAWRGERGAHSGEVALRHDKVGDFGDDTTGQAAWGWRVGDALRILASVGEGFRAPNFNELYSPGFDGLFEGNPELEAERSRALELGADFKLSDSQTLRLRAQHNRVRDLIGFTGENFQATNVRRARIDSLELDWSGVAGAWTWTSAATLLDPIDEDTGQILLRRARSKLSVDIDRSFGERLSVGASAYYAGERRDFAASLSDYSLFDLRAAYRIGDQWRIETRVSNLFDEDYALADGFATPGRQYQVTLRYMR